KLDAAGLRALEKEGIDRVLDLSADLDGRMLKLHARSVWLVGGSWHPLVAEPPAYPERLARAAVAESGEWAVLLRPSEAVGAQTVALRPQNLFQTGGKALDLACGDIDGDGQGDLVLLFADRIEFWQGQDDRFAFRQTRRLPESAASFPQPRDLAGEAAICAAPGKTGRLAIATNALVGGASFSWDGEMLRELGPVAGAPVACIDGAFAFGRYRPGSVLFEPALYPETSAPPLVKFAEPFVSAAYLGENKQWIEVTANGRTRFAGESAPSSQTCGAQPAALPGPGGQKLVCSRASTRPTRDAFRFLTPTDADGNPENAADATPGEIVALSSGPTCGWGVVYAARYLSGENRTQVERLGR
ncbi:MAG: hypothetical protein C4523_03215, partial [Myxococcales bacterium]